MTKKFFNQYNPHFLAFEHYAELQDASKLFHVYWEWITTSGALCWKSIINSSRSLKTTDELKVALPTILKELPQEHINKAVVNFTKCLTVYMAVAANEGHFEHL